MDIDPGTIDIEYPDDLWVARHNPERADGPRVITSPCGDLVRDVSFYLDDLPAEAMLVDRFRAYRKGGCAVVESWGHFPFGAEVRSHHVHRYAANHVRVTTDIRWPAGAVVARHLGVGCLHLPGTWRRYYCVPPCQHLQEGKRPGWQDIPAVPPGSGMIGHWHRPPLALVFERDDGILVEVGTGGDVWRWERNFDFGPEAGSYKLMMAEDGLAFVREPLMTCSEVAPRPRDYRLTWYVSWATPAWQMALHVPPPAPVVFDEDGLVRFPGSAGEEDVSLLLDFGRMPLPDTARRCPTAEHVIRGERAGEACWENRVTQRVARAVVRKMASQFPPGWLVIRGLAPGVCWDGSHVGRPGRALPHWDMDALLDFGVWARQQLGPDWEIRVEAPEWDQLPSVLGLFAVNGFRADMDDLLDDED